MSFAIVRYEVCGIYVNMTITSSGQPGKFNSYDNGGVFQWTCLEDMLKNKEVLLGLQIAVEDEFRKRLTEYICENTDGAAQCYSDQKADVLDGSIVVGNSYESGKKTACFRIVYDLVISSEELRLEIKDLVAIDLPVAQSQEEQSSAA